MKTRVFIARSWAVDNGITKNSAWLVLIRPTMRREGFIGSRPISGQLPQTLPLLQLELEALPNENELPSERREAKTEIFLVTF